MSDGLHEVVSELYEDHEVPLSRESIRLYFTTSPSGSVADFQVNTPLVFTPVAPSSGVRSSGADGFLFGIFWLTAIIENVVP